MHLAIFLHVYHLSLGSVLSPSRLHCVLTSQLTGCERDCTPTADMNEVLEEGYAGWDGEFSH